MTFPEAFVSASFSVLGLGHKALRPLPVFLGTCRKQAVEVQEAGMVFKSLSVGTVAGAALLLAASVIAQTPDDADSASGNSKVRIVRLSEVKGIVHVDRNIGRGFEPGIPNLPIVEGSKIGTDDGVAEVEFEDNSTLRLAPDTQVEFPQLERSPSGSTLSTVHVLKGTAYVSLVSTKGNQFTLAFGKESLALQPSTHLRVNLKETGAEVAVLDGTLHINGPQGSTDVPKKKTVTFPATDSDAPTVAKNVEEETFDSWDHTASGYHARTASLLGSSGSPYSYGVNDLSYYGSFMNSGCGSMWRPYFASAAWDPYSNGVWAYYGGAGYSWVSPYPWGWTAYHTGSWSFCPGAGWGWMPGGGWYGLNNMAMVPSNSVGTAMQHGGGLVGRPIKPIHPPAPGAPTLVAVNSKPLVRSGMTSIESFSFRKDSAGFGIPRDGFGNLSKFSRNTISHGTANTPVYLSAPTSAMSNGRITGAGMPALAVHRGVAPGPTSSGVMPASNRGGPSYGGGSIRSSVSGGMQNSSAGHMSAPPSAPSAPSAPSGGGTRNH